MHVKVALINLYYYQLRHTGSNISLITFLLTAILYHFNLLEEAQVALGGGVGGQSQGIV